jgi:SAM-dependent methyltransferase
MFFSSIYNGWEGIQREKYENIFGVLGNDFLSKMLMKRTLDIGCGSFLRKFLDERGIKPNLYGVDIELQRAERFVLADGNELPFKRERFDFIISIDSMHLIAGDDFRRVLKKRGFVLFSIFFNSENFYQRRGMLLSKLRGFELLAEFELHGKENDLVVLARKRYS